MREWVGLYSQARSQISQGGKSVCVWGGGGGGGGGVSFGENVDFCIILGYGAFGPLLFWGGGGGFGPPSIHKTFLKHH